ncbi:hypothetical protein ACOSQ4_005318 [Xanthoceras sorbifolium]
MYLGLLCRYGPLPLKIFSFMSGGLCKGIRFVSREANGVAYSLAQLVISLDDGHVWMEDCLSSISSLVIAESVSSLVLIV